MFFDDWQVKSEHDFRQFWLSLNIEDEDIRALLPPFENESEFLSTFKFGSQFFDSSNEKLDLKKPVNWRVYHIISILRNLSFEETNKAIMASNLPLLK